MCKHKSCSRSVFRVNPDLSIQMPYNKLTKGKADTTPLNSLMQLLETGEYGRLFIQRNTTTCIFYRKNCFLSFCIHIKQKSNRARGSEFRCINQQINKDLL